MKRRFFRALTLPLLAVFFCLLFPVSAFAAKDQPAEEPAPAEEADTESKTVEIRSLEAFLAFAEGCSLDSYSLNVRFVLTADLDLSGTGFAPIQLFLGTFDGGGHSIRGL